MKILKTNVPLQILIVLVIGLGVLTVINAQQKTGKDEMSCPMMSKTAGEKISREDCPMMKAKSETSTANSGDPNSKDRHAMVMKNGEMAMGFSQTATTHHFLIMKDGGAIQVEANAADDKENRDKIRTHLQYIAQAFKDGIFTTPFAVHGQIPPGVPEMEKFKDKIQYGYEETNNGARVRIKTSDADALAAIHRFLRFQIEDHQTGDPLIASE